MPIESPTATLPASDRIVPSVAIVPHGPGGGDHTNATTAMNALKFRIPGDQVAAACKELPDEQRAAIKWFAGYCRNRNLDKEQISALLKKKNGDFYGWDSIYQLLTGKRAEQGVNIEPIITSIDAFRRQVEAGSRIGDGGFIETRLSAAIWDRCDRARLRKKFAFIFGDSQIGKTASLVEYTRTHNHGETIYVEAPTGGAISTFMQKLGAKLAIPQAHRAGDLRDRIMECFDGKMLLIVDEAHRLLHAGRGIHSLDFIRELYNTAGCGIALAMTHEGRKELHQGRFAKRLEQLWRRRLAPLQLPMTVPEDDLALFAASYDLDAATGKDVAVNIPYTDEHGHAKEKVYKESPLVLQTRVVASEGLGVWLTILQDAKDMAKTQKRPITWAAVLKAYCVSQADAEVWA